MSVSRQEEIIAALWAICAILSYGFGFYLAGNAFTVKAVFDTYCSIKYAAKEIKEERQRDD